MSPFFVGPMNDLLTFVKTRRKEGNFGHFVGIVGEHASFVVAIEILSWLKRQKKLGHEKELELDAHHTWCQQLPTLLQTDLSLGRLFEIVDSRLRFKPGIDRTDRVSIRELVDSEYLPVVRT